MLEFGGFLRAVSWICSLYENDEISPICVRSSFSITVWTMMVQHSYSLSEIILSSTVLENGLR